jgi:ADP-heptose:LPS heptosyltransferase
MARRPVYNLRHYLLQSGVAVADRPVPPLSLKLSAAELAEGQRVLDYFVCPARETICIYTYATGIKCYSREWWAAMYSQLKEAFGETYNILEVLPIENVSQINFEATAYYSDDIREIAAVMAHAALFVGADSGMMHLAAASGTPTVGLFSVTDPAVYRPYSGCNLAIDTNTTGAGGIIAALRTILNYNRYLAPCNN